MTMAIVGTAWLDPMSKLRRFGSTERMGATHGYLLTWIGESVYLDGATLLADAVERAKYRDTSFTDTFGSLPVTSVQNIVIIQFESLDWRALGHTVVDQPLVPFVQQRVTDSILFKATTIHDNGSADADFMWLTGLLPSEHVVTYKIPDYPYIDTLADKARFAGFRSSVVHGNSGDFFDRRLAFERMRFDQVQFSEELFEIGLPESIWGIDDDDVLDYWSAQLTTKSQQLMYLITLTSHQPFHYLPESKRKLPIEQINLNNRYFASLHYTDNAISAFYDTLPDGTLLIVFGDHRSVATFEPEDPNYNLEGETVPLFIHLKGHSLTLGEGIQQPIEADMISIVQWFHRWLAHYNVQK